MIPQGTKIPRYRLIHAHILVDRCAADIEDRLDPWASSNLGTSPANIAHTQPNMVVRPSMRFRELFHRIILNLPVNLRWIRHSLNLEEQAREHKEAIERSVAEANALAAEKVAAMRDAELSGSSAAERVKQIAKEKQEKEKEKLKEKDRKENDKEKEKVKPVDDSADTIKPGMYRVYRNLESALNGIDPIPLENLVHSIFSPNSLEMDIYFVVDALPPAMSGTHTPFIRGATPQVTLPSPSTVLSLPMNYRQLDFGPQHTTSTRPTIPIATSSSTPFAPPLSSLASISTSSTPDPEIYALAERISDRIGVQIMKTTTSGSARIAMDKPLFLRAMGLGSIKYVPPST